MKTTLKKKNKINMAADIVRASSIFTQNGAISQRLDKTKYIVPEEIYKRNPTCVVLIKL